MSSDFAQCNRGVAVGGQEGKTCPCEERLVHMEHKLHESKSLSSFLSFRYVSPGPKTMLALQ